MPLNFPEVWLNRLIQNLTTQNVAPWLDGIPELDVEVLEVGSGDAAEANVIYIPRTSFNPDVLINNTTYPIALQAYSDDNVTVQLDKYQTKVTTLSDDQVVGAAYPRIDAAVGGHVRSINTKKFQKAIHAIAPASDTTNTPVVAATGTAVGGVNQLTYADLITLKDKLDAAEVSIDGRRLVLSTRHYNDLLLDRANFADKLVTYTSGTTAPMIAGFQIYQYAGNPLFTSAGVKKAFGAVKAAGDRQGSVVFWEGGIAKKTGMTKQYFNPSANDPEGQTNKVNYRHYFIAVPFEQRGVGAIY